MRWTIRQDEGRMIGEGLEDPLTTITPGAIFMGGGGCRKLKKKCERTQGKI